MRVSKAVFIIFVLAMAGVSALVAQGGGPPAGGQGGRGQGGRGGGRAGWVQIKQGEECPPGMTEARHLECAPTATPAPSIVDYRPRSTLVTQEHLVPKAKFPVVDVHTHRTSRAEGIAERVKEMDALNLRVLVDLSGGNAAEVKQKVDAMQATPYKDRFRVFANVAWEGAGRPGWQEAALDDLVRRSRTARSASRSSRSSACATRRPTAPGWRSTTRRSIRSGRCAGSSTSR